MEGFFTCPISSETSPGLGENQKNFYQKVVWGDLEKKRPRRREEKSEIGSRKQFAEFGRSGEVRCEITAVMAHRGGKNSRET